MKLSVSSPSRLLSFVKNHLDFSTKDLRWSIENGRCFVNGRIERFCSTRVHTEDTVQIWPLTRPQFIREEKRVLHEEEDFLVYDKPPYIPSSDLAKILNMTLVHRLDRDTSGVILFAKKNPERFEELFRERKIRKTYHAIVEGAPKKTGSFSAPMQEIKRWEGAVMWGISSKGVWSETEWECEKYGPKTTLIRCHPLTGRTHQIRVHMQAIGHPIVGDCIYGNRKGAPGVFRPLLHASVLEFEEFCFHSPLPADIRNPS